MYSTVLTWLVPIGRALTWLVPIGRSRSPDLAPSIQRPRILAPEYILVFQCILVKTSFCRKWCASSVHLPPSLFLSISCVPSLVPDSFMPVLINLTLFSTATHCSHWFWCFPFCLNPNGTVPSSFKPPFGFFQDGSLSSSYTRSQQVFVQGFFFPYPPVRASLN